jgi:hypothetical protein
MNAIPVLVTRPTRPAMNWALWLCCLGLVIDAFPSSGWCQEGHSNRHHEREVLRSNFESDLNALAVECQTLGHDHLAAATRNWIAPRDPSRHYLFLPPSQYHDPGDPQRIERQSRAWPEWSQRVRQRRQDYAQRLYEFAQIAASEQHWHIASSVLWEALWQNPELADVRRVLDYQGLDSEIEKINIRVARKAENSLGWPSGSYREGNAGQFRVLTTADEDAARELLHQLQVWRILWRQICFPYWINNEGVAQAIKAGRPIPGGVETKHTVVLFANRAAFLQALRRVPGIEQSVGYYDSEAARCYFYLDAQDPNVLATQKHELVHQLFQETGKRVRQPGEKSNFWLLEAAAMYFESLHPLQPQTGEQTTTRKESRGEIWSVGGFDAQRLQFARLRWQRENYLTPFQSLVVRGRQDFQRDSELSRLYSQSAGMFHYLMHAPSPAITRETSDPHTDTATADRRAVRNPGDANSASAASIEAAFRMLTKIYAGRDRADLLESETGQTLAELEAGYREWLAFAAEQDAAFLPLASEKLELALGFSELDDEALGQLRAPRLTTLQLTRTKITDAALQRLAADHHQLQDLYLDQTVVSDMGVLALIHVNPHIESLDLAGSQISDESVLACQALPNLEALWLTQTNVTDEVVPTLLAMPKLRTLDVQGTKISPELQQTLRDKFK